MTRGAVRGSSVTFPSGCLFLRVLCGVTHDPLHSDAAVIPPWLLLCDCSGFCAVRSVP